ATHAAALRLVSAARVAIDSSQVIFAQAQARVLSRASERFDAMRRWFSGQEAPRACRRATRSAVTCLGRQHAEVDADLAQRLGVFVLGILTEDQLKVGGAVQPAILVDLGLELARGPARIAKCKHCALRTIAARDRFEDVERGSETDALVDRQGGVLDEEI